MLTPFLSGHREETSLADKRQDLMGSPTQTSATHLNRSQQAPLLYATSHIKGGREAPIRNSVRVKTMSTGHWWDATAVHPWGPETWQAPRQLEEETLRSGSQCKNDDERLCPKDSLTHFLSSEATGWLMEIWKGRPPT